MAEREDRRAAAVVLALNRLTDRVRAATTENRKALLWARLEQLEREEIARLERWFAL